MPAKNDARLVVGNRVHTKAKFFTSDSKCRRMYGASWKSKMVVGTVLKAIRSRVKDRRTTSVLAKWELVEDTKVVCLRLSNIKAVGEEEESINPVQIVNDDSDQVLEFVSDDEDLTNALVTPDSPELVVTRSKSPSDTVHQVGPLINCHGNDWVKSDVTLALNGFVKSRRWKVIGPVDEIITSGHVPCSLTPYDFFMWMFPLDHLELIVNHTNKKLNNQGLPVTSRGEVLRYFGIKNMGGRLMQKNMKFDVTVMAFLKVTFMIVF